MDIVAGIVVWGGLLLLVLMRLGRDRGPTSGYGTGGRSTSAAAPAPAAPPQATAQPPVRPADHQRRREDDALVDGLIIGAYLAHTHHRDRTSDLEVERDELLDERERWEELAVGGDVDDGDGGDDHLDDPYVDLHLVAHGDHDPFAEVDDVGPDPWTDPWGAGLDALDDHDDGY